MLSYVYEHTQGLTDQIRSDQSLSRVWLFATPWIAALQASLSITNSGYIKLLTFIDEFVFFVSYMSQFFYNTRINF